MTISSVDMACSYMVIAWNGSAAMRLAQPPANEGQEDSEVMNSSRSALHSAMSAGPALACAAASVLGPKRPSCVTPRAR